MAITTLSRDFLGRKLTLETGKLAKLATGAVVVTYGDTQLLVTATLGKKPRGGVDFFPLLVDYQEKFYATGKIKGSRFIKREGRPSDSSILAGRMIDRPLRPLFPKKMRNDFQIVVSVLSADMDANPEDISILGASAACLLTGVPFYGAVAGVRVGLIMDENGKEKLVVNPNYEQVLEGRLDLMVAGSEHAITMIEAASKEVDTDTMMAALELAHTHIKELCAMQKEFIAACGPIEPKKVVEDTHEEEVDVAVKAFITKEKVDTLFNVNKQQLDAAMSKLEADALENFASEIKAERENNPWSEKVLKDVINEQMQYFMRKKVLDEGVRLDGRKLTEVRPISCEAGLVPRTHGSGLFNRGETQILSLATLGAPGEAQTIEEMDESIEKRYMHHYNFPGFSVGEVAPMRGPGRREIGHGDLAERAIVAVLPSKEEFPYVLRVVSEALASNGSTSMGSVCGSTLCLLDAGVPLKRPVSGIAMGLIMDKETKQYQVLTDIQGQEDFLGDMDFKVAGTEKGITALQLDIKIDGLTFEILRQAIEQANIGRAFILEKMMEVLSSARPELSKYAPRIISLRIDPSSIAEVIGPGGKIIRGIIEATGVKIDIEDDGLVLITSSDAEQAKAAKEWIERLTFRAKVGDEFDARVTKIATFGAFAEYLPGKEGLIHISELAPMRIDRVEDVTRVGEVLRVKVKGIDDSGKVSLTHKPFSKMAEQHDAGERPSQY